MDTLEAKLGMNSQNSSKPPSPDGLARKNKTSSLHGKSDKAVGGQPGHKGKQGHSMLEVLRRTFAGDPIMPVA
ncbi:DUF6444 domain-containing protein [Massilia glaciei]|uniref:DUF6444 domain-containing protein n=1 Tax=Massilia glaciei TaxID=1524097 RepID=A0A2U2HA17_9BURK|nr:DUF6444 domain-containing protein [Massilia glaciei]PWF39528.1 hypothetical protein C7C56_026570 [Massilia glaciei]